MSARRVTLWVDPGDSMAGHLAIDTGDPQQTQRFEGWLDLISRLARLLETPGRDAPQRRALTPPPPPSARSKE